jgi:CRP-like cAMP-binding protein
VTSARSDLLNPVALFAALDAASLRNVTEAARIRETKAGDSFFREGDPAESFFVVQTGSVKLIQVTPEGHQVVLRLNQLATERSSDGSRARCCDSSSTPVAALIPASRSICRCHERTSRR